MVIGFQLPFETTLWITCPNLSIIKTNKYGEMESACRTLLEVTKSSVNPSFHNTYIVGVDTHCIINLTKLPGCFASSMVSLMKSYLSRSYTFSISIFIAIHHFLPFLILIEWITSSAIITLSIMWRPPTKLVWFSTTYLGITSFNLFATTLVSTLYGTMHKLIGRNYVTTSGPATFEMRIIEVLLRNSSISPSSKSFLTIDTKDSPTILHCD